MGMDDLTSPEILSHFRQKGGHPMIYSVYLIDDEPMAVEELKREIPWQQYGMQVIGSQTSPREGLKEAAALHPHAVFSDMKMPGMDGVQLARALHESLPHSEIVIVSAWSDFDYARRAMREGCFDYILKPLRAAEYGPTLQRLYSRLSEKTPAALPADGSPLEEISNYIRAHFAERITLSDLSDQFHLSQNTICSYFNRYLGTTFVSFLTDLRMKEAEKLLGQTALSIKEIAARSGYDDYFYFCRVFQRQFSCTPSQLRVRIRLNGGGK